MTEPANTPNRPAAGLEKTFAVGEKAFAVLAKSARSGKGRGQALIALVGCVCLGAFLVLAKEPGGKPIRAVVQGVDQSETVLAKESGVVKKIGVKVGDRIGAEDMVVLLESGRDPQAVENLRDAVERRNAYIVRLRALADGLAEPNFGPELERARPDLVKAEREVFFQDRERLTGEINRLKEDVDRLARFIETLKTRINQNRADLGKLIGPQGVATNPNEANRLKARIEEDKAALVRSEDALKAGRDKLGVSAPDFKEEALRSLKSAEKDRDDLMKRFEKAKSAVKETKAPAGAAGYVKAVRVEVGAQVKAGDPLVEIVRDDRAGLVEALIENPGDLDLSKSGQTRLSTPDGRLNGLEALALGASQKPPHPTGANVAVTLSVSDPAALRQAKLAKNDILLLEFGRGGRSLAKALTAPFRSSSGKP